jgi:hydroxymethylpyrimidine/phosphomethylpyrimidine kinase
LKCNVYLKGGHGISDSIEEYLIEKDNFSKFIYPKHDWHYTHGTGCAFSSLFSMYMTKYDLKTSCIKAHKRVTKIFDKINSIQNSI